MTSDSLIIKIKKLRESVELVCFVAKTTSESAREIRSESNFYKCDSYDLYQKLNFITKS